MESFLCSSAGRCFSPLKSYKGLADYITGESAVLQVAHAPSPLFRTSHPGVLELFPVFLAGQLQPLRVIEVNVCIHQGFRHTARLQFLADSQRPEAASRARIDIAFGKARIALQAFSLQVVQQGFDFGGREFPRFEFPCQFETRVFPS